LLDEFEKGYAKILDLFLQVLDDGRLTDNKGKTVSFVNTIIIATSNAGAEFIREEIKKGTKVDKSFSHQLLDYLQSNHLFRPELINRFDDVIIFRPLGREQMVQVTYLMLQSVARSLQEQDITISFDEPLINKIVAEGFDPQFGARPLRRYIQDNVEDILAKQKLREEIVRGSNILLTVDGAGSIVVKHI
jgi:ATP-dependent Clp protease ATP-binding subunit ClpA